MSKSYEQRYIILDGIRGLSAVGIMLYHYSITRTFDLLPNMPSGVDLFFMMSGFVLSHSYGERLLNGRLSYQGFLIRRLIRFCPMLLAGLLIGALGLKALCSLGLGTYSDLEIVKSVIVNTIFLPFFNQKYSYMFGKSFQVVGMVSPTDGASWSLSFELLANLFLFFLIKKSRKGLVRIVSLFGFIMIMTGMGLAWSENFFGVDLNAGWSTDNFYQGFPRVAYTFAFGVLIHRLVQSRESVPYKNRSFLTKAFIKQPLLLYFVLIATFAIPSFAYGWVMALTVIGIAPTLLYLGAHCKSDNLYLLKTSEYLGWLSYPLYCLHIPIGNLIAAVYVKIGFHDIPLTSFILISSLASVALCTLIGRYCDNPIRSFLLKKYLYKEKGSLAS